MITITVTNRNGEKFTMCKGTIKRYIPKLYKYVNIESFPELSSDYNSGLAEIYLNKKGEMFYSIYRDGCFYPYFGRLIKQ